jgi:undecaprenyl-diphosphatase
MWKWVALATLPALIAGALFHRVVEESLRGNSILATTLCGGGVLLWVLDRYSSAKKSLSALHFKDALAVSFGQCLALVPGMSRSGSTMMVARALGYSRESSARFSFLLSAPITAAALIFELRKWNEVIASVDSMSVIFAGACSAFIFGWIAIDGLLRLVKRFGYLSFAIYRFLLAAIIMTVLG